MIQVSNVAKVHLPKSNQGQLLNVLSMFSYTLNSGDEFANFNYEDGVAYLPPNIKKIRQISEMIGEPIEDLRSPGAALKSPFEPKDGFKLRGYQVQPARQLYAHIRDHQAGTLSAGCGTGKTVVMTYVSGWFQSKVLVLVDQSNLIPNWQDAFWMIWGKNLQQIKAGATKFADCCICTFQLLNRNPELLIRIQNEFGTLLVDEAHTVKADTFRDVILSINVKYRIGCSATFFGKNLPQGVLDDLVAPVCVTMVDKDALTPSIFMLNTDVGWPSEDPSEFGSRILPAVAANDTRNLLAFKVLHLLAKAGRRILVVGIKKAQMTLLVQMLAQVGVTALEYTGVTSQKKDRQVKADFEAGKLQVVMTCKKLDKGTDYPTADALVNLKPNNNETATKQQSGRVVRKVDGKPKPIVIDFVDSGGLSKRFAGNRKRWYRGLKYEVIDNQSYTDLNNFILTL